MKYHVRNEHGELVVPSLRELQVLYQRQFVSDEDEIRREGLDRWCKAADLPSLRVIKPRPWFRGFEFAWLAIAISLGTLVMALLFFW